MNSRDEMRIFAIHYQERLTINGEKQQPLSFVGYFGAKSAEQAQAEFEFIAPAISQGGGKVGAGNNPNTTLDIIVTHVERVKVPGYNISLERTYDLDMPTERT